METGEASPQTVQSERPFAALLGRFAGEREELLG